MLIPESKFLHLILKFLSWSISLLFLAMLFPPCSQTQKSFFFASGIVYLLSQKSHFSTFLQPRRNLVLICVINYLYKMISELPGKLWIPPPCAFKYQFWFLSCGFPNFYRILLVCLLFYLLCFIIVAFIPCWYIYFLNVVFWS